MERTVEILQYTLLKGTGTIFHTIMREISVPLHQRHGIDVVSFGNSLHDPIATTLFVLLTTKKAWLWF